MHHIVIAGFFTGGALAVRGGVKAARNSAIGCGILLAVIEGVGIGLNRSLSLSFEKALIFLQLLTHAVMAGNNVPQNPPVIN